MLSLPLEKKNRNLVITRRSSSQHTWSNVCMFVGWGVVDGVANVCDITSMDACGQDG